MGIHSCTPDCSIFSPIFQKSLVAGQGFDSGAWSGNTVRGYGLAGEIDFQVTFPFTSTGVDREWRENKLEIKSFLLIEISKSIPLRIEHRTAGP